ncbi:hypothetical protein CAAN1_09S04896 [[Candida] anglica]|uniref:Uncharacterized protein n=1 Tax=[Candida] anglica TaxID=148631 RepID=A0ABP0EF71_9ASCO
MLLKQYYIRFNITVYGESKQVGYSLNISYTCTPPPQTNLTNITLIIIFGYNFKSIVR